MLKVVFCLKRRPELTAEEFRRYWLESHGPLVRSHAETLRIRRYVQAHTLDSPATEMLRRGRGGPEPFDGVAELWWDGEEDLVEAAAPPEGGAAARALLEDERRFLDLPRSPIWVAREHVIVGDR